MACFPGKCNNFYIICSTSSLLFRVLVLLIGGITFIVWRPLSPPLPSSLVLIKLENNVNGCFSLISDAYFRLRLDRVSQVLEIRKKTLHHNFIFQLFVRLLSPSSLLMWVMICFTIGPDVRHTHHSNIGGDRKKNSFI